MAFRQHLQNLARTKGILELNKVYEQMGSGETPSLGLLSLQAHPHGLLDPALQVSTAGELLETTDLRLFCSVSNDGLRLH